MTVELLLALGAVLLVTLAVLLDSGPPAEPSRHAQARTRSH
jgi:hypothetical protein